MQPLILSFSSPRSRWRSGEAKRVAIFCAIGIERALARLQ